jgi:RNA polymerase sigma factor (TIGR02999 family)
VKLASAGTVVPASALHFKRLAARAMRQVLVEAARRRLASKRGGGDVPLVTFDEAVMPPEAGARQLLALDDALEMLAALNPRHAAVVECRFFAGMDVAETAAALDVSEATVLRDWRAARAFLAVQLRSTR